MKLGLLVCALSLLCVGCVSQPTPEANASAPLLISPDEQTFETAQTLLKEGRSRDALTHFMALQRKAEDLTLRRRATLGAAQALRAENNFAGAVAVLSPLPLAVRDALDARRCALAGELNLRQKAYEPAVVALERALAFEGDPDGAWRPVAWFNLGKCALALGLPEQAKEAFTKARVGFEAQGNLIAAERCAGLLSDLEMLLKQATQKTTEANRG